MAVNSLSDDKILLNRILIRLEVLEDFKVVGNLHSASQAFIYKLLTDYNKSYGLLVHDKKFDKGFTFSPFRFDKKPLYFERPLFLKRGQTGYIEVFTHTEQFNSIFLSGFFQQYVSSYLFDIFQHQVRVTGVEIGGQFNPIPLDSPSGSPERIILNFSTLTWFRLQHDPSSFALKEQGYKLREKKIHFPEPRLFYQSLRDKIKVYPDLNVYLPDESEFYEFFHLDMIIYQKYLSTFTIRDNNARESHYGFTGRVRYFLDGPPAIRNKIYNFILLGTYFGVGARTSMGFGRYSIEPDDYTSVYLQDSKSVDRPDDGTE